MINSERQGVEVSPGPFDVEPVELGRALSDGFDPAVSGEAIERRTAAWLTGVLANRGVVLGDADREIVDALAAEGWSVAQVVAGWVCRAERDRTSSSTAPTEWSWGSRKHGLSIFVPGEAGRQSSVAGGERPTSCG